MRKTTISVAIMAAGLLLAPLAQAQDIPYQDVRPQRLTPEQVEEAQQRAVQGTPINRNLDEMTPEQREARIEQLRLEAMTQNMQYDEYGRPIIEQPGFVEERVSPFVKDAIDSYKPEQHIKMNPRQNRIVPVGFGFMNAIQTNFNTLAVRTSDEHSILEVEDGYLYVTPLSEQPISLILYEDGVLESQVSLVLYPIDAPPAMIDVNVSLSPQMLAKARRHQDEIEQEARAEEARRRQAQMQSDDLVPSSHIAYLTNILKTIAQEKLPRGFTLTNDVPNHLKHPCRVTISQFAGQRLAGTREVVDVVLLQNNTDGIYHVREEMCLGKDVLSVAIHNKAYLQPGQSTEVYIVRDRFYEEERVREVSRPSLRRGGE